MTAVAAAPRADLSSKPRLTVAEMKDNLLTLDHLDKVLSSTEPLTSEGFGIGPGVKFELQPAWNHGLETVAGDEPVSATVQFGIGGPQRQLTKDALLEATSLCGITKGYASRTPGKFIADQLNYWFSEGLGDKNFKALIVNDDKVAAIARGTVMPFSNLRLLEKATDGIYQKYGKGAEILVDRKLSHSLRGTAFRLIVPEDTRTLVNTGTDDDTWSAGLNVTNSLIGDGATKVDGFLFRWWCSNGAIDTLASSGAWSRRSGGQGDEVYDWAREAVDEVLGGLEHSFDKVQALTDVPLSGEVTDVLRELFAQYKIPGSLRSSITDAMANEPNLTMYTLMQAVTQAANAAGLEPGHIEQIMAFGGDIPHREHSRCDACHRVSI